MAHVKRHLLKHVMEDESAKVLHDLLSGARTVRVENAMFVENSRSNNNGSRVCCFSLIASLSKCFSVSSSSVSFSG